MQRSDETELHALFDEIDIEHDGLIKSGELQRALEKLGLPHNSKEYLAVLQKQLDRNRDGVIDFKDFREYVLSKEKVAAKTFASLDADGSGSISVTELTAALKGMWLPVDSRDAVHMIHLLDRDHNGEVTFDEFRRFVFLLPASQMSRENIIYSWVDSADWAEGIEYDLTMMPPKQPFQRFMAGAVAGGASRAASAPFERLRTMMMADSRNSHFLATARKMWHDGGVLGLFRGNLATMAKVLPQTAIQFAVYDTAKDLLMMRAAQKGVETAEAGTELSRAQHMLAGALAGGVATLVTYPCDTLRCHMSMGSRSYAKVVKDIVQSHGMAGIYRGVNAGLLTNIIANAVGFASYEQALASYRKWKPESVPSPAERGCLAGAASIVVMSATMPLENICRRLQIQGREGHPVLYHGPWDCAKRMLASEGITSFWRGSLGTYLKVAPSIGAVRFLYEFLIQRWGVGGLHHYRVNQEAPAPTNAPP